MVPPSRPIGLIAQLYALPKMFFSFDFSEDRDAACMVAGQMKNKSRGFMIEDWSLKEAAPQRMWREKARRKMAYCDLLVVVVGNYTYRATGVLAEVRIAHDLGLPVVSVARNNAIQPLLTPVPGAGRVHRLTPETIERFIAMARRHAA